MNDEMKKLISRFLFSSVLICCFGLLAAGSITASQKSAKNTFDKAYAVMNIKSTREKIKITMGEKEFSMPLGMADKIKEYEDYIILTPFASAYFLGRTVEKIAADNIPQTADNEAYLP